MLGHKVFRPRSHDETKWRQKGKLLFSGCCRQPIANVTLQPSQPGLFSTSTKRAVPSRNVRTVAPCASPGPLTSSAIAARRPASAFTCSLPSRDTLVSATEATGYDPRKLSVLIALGRQRRAAATTAPPAPVPERRRRPCSLCPSPTRTADSQRRLLLDLCPSGGGPTRFTRRTLA